MKLLYLFCVGGFLLAHNTFAQSGWVSCNTPTFQNRIDDLFMANNQIGYAVCGDGKIVKTVDSGVNWSLIAFDDSVYCRSVEFTSTLKGFVGGFPTHQTICDNILRETTDGGATWTDLTPLLNPYARNGICGLAAPDSNTIYGCGNWYQDSAYIIKSTDGGSTWSYIDMHLFASSLIDMYFLNKDTGFATGKGPLPLETAVILYTTDGGATWVNKFQDTAATEYCWKIQRLDSMNYFASIENFTNQPVHILRSVNGGMTWSLFSVQQGPYDIEGVGFLDSLHGWTGGDFSYAFETFDGGVTWDTIYTLEWFNRFFRMNDSVAFAAGFRIWKYNPTATGVNSPPTPTYSTLSATPNPADENITLQYSVAQPTRVTILLCDVNGKIISNVENALKPEGEYLTHINTSALASGTYLVVMKTYEDKQIMHIVVAH